MILNARSNRALATAALLAAALATVQSACGGDDPTPMPSGSSGGVASLALAQDSVASGSTVVATITLTVAPTGNDTIALSSSNTSVATVPPTVAVAGGASTAAFTVTAVGVGTATISASYGNTSRSATLNVTQAPAGLTLLSIGLNSSTVLGGQSVGGVVTLSGPAPAGGAVVTLQSSDPSVATVPANVTVAAGATTATFTVSTRSTGATFQIAIGAAFGGVTRTANLTVATSPPPFGLSSVTLSASSVVGGNNVTGTATLNQAAPSGGTIVELSAAPAGVVSLPANVTVPAGSSSATFTVTTSTTTTSRTVTITGTVGGSSQTATLTVTPIALTASVSVSGPSGVDTCLLTSGSTADCTFDGRSSTGPITQWTFTYVLGTQSLTGNSTNGQFSPVFGGCGFFQSLFPTASTTSIGMDVRVRVSDAGGNTADSATRTVKITAGGSPGSPGQCGYSF